MQVQVNSTLTWVKLIFRLVFYVDEARNNSLHYYFYGLYFANFSVYIDSLRMRQVEMPLKQFAFCKLKTCGWLKRSNSKQNSWKSEKKSKVVNIYPIRSWTFFSQFLCQIRVREPLQRPLCFCDRGQLRPN
jgi:hypothetical protein